MGAVTFTPGPRNVLDPLLADAPQTPVPPRWAAARPEGPRLAPAAAERVEFGGADLAIASGPEPQPLRRRRIPRLQPLVILGVLPLGAAVLAVVGVVATEGSGQSRPPAQLALTGFWFGAVAAALAGGALGARARHEGRWLSALLVGGAAFVTMTLAVLVGFVVGQSRYTGPLPVVSMADPGAWRLVLQAGLALAVLAVLGWSIGVWWQSPLGAGLVAALALVVGPLVLRTVVGARLGWLLPGGAAAEAAGAETAEGVGWTALAWWSVVSVVGAAVGPMLRSRKAGRLESGRLEPGRVAPRRS